MNRRNYMLEITFYKTLHKAYSVYLNDGYKRTVTHLPAEKNEFRFAVDGDPASSFSDRFYLTFKDIIPPLSFHNEKADAVMGSHLITWEVQNQMDVKFFLVEYSGDGQLFNLLQNITPSENKDDSYQFSHIPVHRDPVYYRIRAMMKNDTFNTSKILSVGHFNTPPYLTLYPNPAKQVLYLKFHYPQRGTCNIRLVNNEGKTSLVKTIHHNGYPMTDKIDLNAISGGVYHLEITKPGGAKEIQKILIEQTGK